MNPAKPLKHRVASIDILRGLIMLVMTLDHCRDFLHFQGPQHNPTNMATTTVLLFFTRWITHYCAPVFVFLSGVSAYLAGQRRTKSELSAFLIKRGLWLILIDAVIITFLFTFNPAFNGVVLEVLWAIGASMIILGLLVRAPLTVIGILGCIIFFGHNLLDGMPMAPNGGAGTTLLKIFLTAPAVFVLSPNHMILEAYAILPWTAVMFIGYVFGSFYKSSFDAARRRRILLIAGLSLIALFVILRYINSYGDPAPWSVQRNFAHTLLSFLNTTKYPASLIYLSMTLGPALILLSITEHIQNKLGAFCMVYGNVPFFYFILHIALIRVINIILIMASGIDIWHVKSPDFPFMFEPVPFGYPLWVVYLIWILVIALLYLPCRWFANYKRSHQQWWLSYL